MVIAGQGPTQLSLLFVLTKAGRSLNSTAMLNKMLSTLEINLVIPQKIGNIST